MLVHPATIWPQRTALTNCLSLHFTFSYGPPWFALAWSVDCALLFVDFEFDSSNFVSLGRVCNHVRVCYYAIYNKYQHYLILFPYQI